MKKENYKLIQTTGKAKYLPNFILAPILAFIFMVVGSTLGVMIQKNIFGYNDMPAIENSTELVVLFTCINLVLLLWLFLVEKRSFRTLGFYKKGAISQYFKGFILGVLLIAIVMVVLSIFGQTYITFHIKDFLAKGTILNIFILLVGWIVQGGTEEIVTRGWLMNVLSKRYNLPLGVILSSTFFGVLHASNKSVNVLAVINLVLFGLFLALYALKTDNLWGVCGIHSAWNWAQGNIFGQNVSGTDTYVSSIFKSKNVGSILFTGGDFGPEGGTMVTAVLVICIILTLASLIKNPKINS